MPRYRITITSEDREAMLDLVRKHKIHVLDHGSGSTPAGYTAHAIVEQTEIEKLEKAGYKVHRHEDVDEVGKRRQQDVGRGDRYKSSGRR
jgi:hypothetical protein